MPARPAVRQRLADLMERRRLDLGLTWREVAEAGNISYEVIRAIRNGSGRIRPLSKHGIEVGLRWEAESVDRILAGDDPVPLADTGAPRALHPGPRAPGLNLGGNDPEALHPYVQPILQRIYDRLGLLDYLPSAGTPYPDQLPPSLDAEARVSAIPGGLLFPDDPHAQAAWGNPEMTVRQRVDLIAWGHRVAEQIRQQQDRRTGLHRSQSAAAGNGSARGRVCVAGTASRASH